MIAPAVAALEVVMSLEAGSARGSGHRVGSRSTVVLGVLLLVAIVVAVSPSQRVLVRADDETTVSVSVDQGLAAPSDACDGAYVVTRIDGAEEGLAEVAFLRITLQPGVAISLPAEAGPVCVESGSAEADLSGSGQDWQPVEGVTFEFGWNDLSLRAAGSEPATLLVVLTGRDVRRFAIPEGATVSDLGGGPLYLLSDPLALIRIDKISLALRETAIVDTGLGGSAVIAVERGEVALDLRIGGINALTRHDGRPLSSQEVTDFDSGDSMISVVPAGYSTRVDEALVHITAGDEGADVTLLSIDTTSAMLAGEYFDVENEKPATPVVSEGSPVALPACTAPELTEEAFDAFFGEPIPSPTIQAMIERPVYAPGDGEPASADVAEEIEATIEQLAACGDDASVYRWLGLFTFRFLAMYLLAEDDTYESVGQMMSFEETPEQTRVAVWDVRVQRDGRVTAKVELDGAAQIMTFEQVGGRWLIDDTDQRAIIEPVSTETP